MSTIGPSSMSDDVTVIPERMSTVCCDTSVVPSTAIMPSVAG